MQQRAHHLHAAATHLAQAQGSGSASLGEGLELHQYEAAMIERERAATTNREQISKILGVLAGIDERARAALKGDGFELPVLKLAFAPEPRAALGTITAVYELVGASIAVTVHNSAINPTPWIGNVSLLVDVISRVNAASLSNIMIDERDGARGFAARVVDAYTTYKKHRAFILSHVERIGQIQAGRKVALEESSMLKEYKPDSLTESVMAVEAFLR